MASVRLDPATEALLRRLAASRGQTKSEVIRDAIASLAEPREEHTALDSLAPFVGVCDSGGLQLSRRTGRRLRELLEEKRVARRVG